MRDDSETLTEIVTANLRDSPDTAQQWIAIALASIADALDDIALALEQPAPRRKRVRK